MTNEAIEKIRQTEAAAEAIVADARTAADEKIRLAKSAAEELMQKAEAEASEKAAAMGKAAADHAAGVAARGAELSRTEAKKTVAAAEPRTDAAVREIIQEIFEKWQ